MFNYEKMPLPTLGLSGLDPDMSEEEQTQEQIESMLRISAYMSIGVAVLFLIFFQSKPPISPS